MENVTDPSLQPDSSLQPIPVPLRNLQPTTFQHHPLTAQLGPEYDSAGFHTYGISDVQQHVNEPQAQALHQQQQQQQSGPSLQQTPSRYPPPPPPHGSFNVISPSHQHPHQPGPAVSFQLTPNQDGSPAKEMGGGHFPGMKAILDPPNLQEWREKLFNVNEMITLTEDE